MRRKSLNRNFHKPGHLQKVTRILALALLLIGSTGCVSRIAAGRIVAAPNQTQSSFNQRLAKSFDWSKFQKAFPADDSNHRFSFVTIPVGPPNAKLKAIIFPPRDYRIEVASKYRETTNGSVLNLRIYPATNSFTPLKEPATIVLLHGYSMTKESMTPWAFSLAQAGYRVVLIDLRGHGQSTGWQVSFGKHETKDLSRVLDYLMDKNLCDGQVGVLGLSYGATLALHWAAHDPRVRTVVAIAPYNQPDEAMERLAVALKTPVSRKTIREAAAIASGKLKLNWTDWSGETAVRHLKEPVLLIGGDKDTVCPPEDVERLKQLAPIGSKSIQVSKANHFALGYWFHELAEPVIAWFHQHLEQAAELNPEQLLISERDRDGDSSKSIQQRPKQNR